MTNRALVVDDSRTIRLILGKMLADMGLEVTTAGDAAEAIRLIQDGLEPQLCLVDWNMPGMNGLEFIRTVRQPPISSAAKILMVTTETELASMQAALESGADEYLMKPFTREGISEKLAIMGIES